jgi:hypothetical protein
MSSSIDVRDPCALPLPGAARGAVRWICTKNPFYVISAGLFLVGLRVSFGTQALEDVWALMGGLAGYALLLAVTAWLLIRFGRVWDDARTVLLLVVLLFLATSVTFDEVLVLHPAQGAVCCVAGLAFAVGLSEGLLRGIRLRLPALFRVPYHLTLALFFLYPLLLSRYADEPRSEVTMWGLFAFSPAAGLVFLTLLPAARRGSGYVRDNGSPWPWPLYPWALFGVLAFAVAGRAFLLCWSLHLLDAADLGGLMFGPYFLVPFGFALTVLLLEAGLASSRGALGTALAAPLGLVLLSQVGHRDDAIYQRFLDLFAERLGGTPLYVTVLAAAAFYAYAALRRVPRSADVLTAAVALLAAVGPDTLTLEAASPVRPLPLVAAALLQLGLGFWQRHAGRYLIGTAAATALAGLFVGAPEALELGLVALLVGGARFGDVLGRALRSVGALVVLGYGLGVLFAGVAPPESLATAPVEAFPLVLAALLAAYGLMLGHRLSQGAAGVLVVGWLASLGWLGYGLLRQLIAGLDYLALSLVVFALAVLTSLLKSGILARLYAASREAMSGESG